MNIIQAIQDSELGFRSFLADKHDSLESWYTWMAALRCLYGLPIPKARWDTVRQCTLRDPATLPVEGFKTALFLTGRRSGKSRIASTIAAYEAVLGGGESKLAPGERGVVAVVSPSRRQSMICRRYIRSIFSAPMLENEVSREDRNVFDLTNGVSIEVLTGDWRTIRGHSVIAAIVDEVCFMGEAETNHVRTSGELIRALLPSLATTGGRLVAISSVYARKDWAYAQWKKNQDCPGRTLVWTADSRTMNATLPASVVEDAYAEDPQSAAAEYLSVWRDDVACFISREVVEARVVQGRMELPPRPDIYRHHAFFDASGGRGDDAALAISHREPGSRTVALDCLTRWKPPLNPYDVIKQASDILRRYQIRRCGGDRYAAEYTVQAFREYGIRYVNSELSKSELYLELLPRLCGTGEIELIDSKILVDQLAALERRTRSGGRDIVDHPHGGHDDCSNAVAGSLVACFSKRTLAGALQ